ncbi:MAG: rhodanese-like domain-containing protein [Lautropia sp.]
MRIHWHAFVVGLCMLGLWSTAQSQRVGDPGAAASSARDARLESMAPVERAEFGVAPTQRLHDGAMHGPTPASIPGGQVITTQGLIALVERRQVPVLVFDVLGQPQSLPNAIAAAWLARPGSFDDDVQRQATQWLAGLTRGRTDLPLVFYCLSRECWMSYNAALRAIRAGYTNVLWYRGGVEAWTAAGLPLQASAPPPVASPSIASPSVAPPTALPPSAVSPSGVAPGTQAPAQSALRIERGRFFTFALPPGWRVGEDGQFALTRVAPDGSAMAVMVGNAGLPLVQSPAQYAYARLSAIRPRGLELGAPRQARPVAGFGEAVEFDVRYWSDAGEHRGVAKVSMARGYDSAVMAMTASLSTAVHWPAYAGWLPLVADQIAATDGAAFGRRGIMQQNLRNSTAFGEAAREYRDWSQRNWQAVTDQRNAGIDRRHAEFREAIGGVQTYANPFGAGPPVELPTTHGYYWQDRQGRTFGTDDPGVNPNVGSTGEWRRMERIAR